MPDAQKFSVLPCEDDVLLLRQVGQDDEADLFEIYGHPDVMAYASDPVFRDIDDVRTTILSIQGNIDSGVALELGIVLKSTGKLIGICGLHSFGPGTAEIGYLLNRDYWGQGWMRRALTAFLRTYPAALHLSSITARVERDNGRSSNTLQTLGFRFLGEEDGERIYGLSLASNDNACSATALPGH